MSSVILFWLSEKKLEESSSFNSTLYMYARKQEFIGIAYNNMVFKNKDLSVPRCGWSNVKWAKEECNSKTNDSTPNCLSDSVWEIQVSGWLHSFVLYIDTLLNVHLWFSQLSTNLWFFLSTTKFKRKIRLHFSWFLD